jgi:hypothetical protein
MEFNNHKYAIFLALEINNIDHSQIVGSLDTLRWNVDGTKAVVEFAPGSSYYNLPDIKSHKEILDIMMTPEWNYPDDII